MTNVRKSTDGRKRTRTMEYIDNQVDISEEISQKLKFSKRNSEQSYLSRQISDISLNRSINEGNKTITEFKGRDHVRRAMKTTNKPIMEYKNPKLIQELLAKKQDIHKSISNLTLQYDFIDHNGRKSKSRKTSDIITDMTHQLESLKPNRQSATSALLRIIKIESVCNQLLCYCQYVDNHEDLVLFFDPNNEQTKTLNINDQIRVAQQSQYNLNIPSIGSISMGITDIQKESHVISSSQDPSIDTMHTYDFNCSCNQCHPTGDNCEQVFSSTFDLLSTFPRMDFNQHSNEMIIYDSFTYALMTKRIFDLRASIIIYNPNKRNKHFIFIVRDGIGNCLEILLNDIHELSIEIQTKSYVFHQIEFIERIESPRECQRWPYDNYLPPKKLFSFKSRENRVSIL